MSEEGVGKRKPPPPPGEKPQLVQNDSRSQVAVRNYEKPSESEKTTGLDKPSDENLIDGSNTSDENAEHYKADDFRWDSYGAYLGGKAFLDFYTRLVKNRWEWFRSDRVTSIRFGDLCNLYYQPGYDVYEPESEQRVWRVTKVTGGRPVLWHLCYGPMDTDERRGAKASNGDGTVGSKSRNEDDKASDSLINKQVILQGLQSSLVTSKQVGSL